MGRRHVFSDRSVINREQGSSHTSTQLMLNEKLEVNLRYVLDEFGESIDLVCRQIPFGSTGFLSAVLYLDSLADEKTINQQIIQSVQTIEIDSDSAFSNPQEIMELFSDRLLALADVESLTTLDELIEAILRGRTVLLVDECTLGLGMSTIGWESRSIKEPQNENEVRGPKEAFIENLSTNLAMIRRKINNRNVRFTVLVLGSQTNTNVCLAYLNGIAPQSLVDEVKSRMGKIDASSLFETNDIEEWIQDHPYSVFPQMEITEKPDRVAAMMLDGKIAILVDGTPHSLIVPTVFMQYFTTTSDYYTNFYFSSLLRGLRLFAFIIALITPALYIAITTMHQEMLPTILALEIAGTRSDVPFPAVVEALVMEIAFELLREAGIRLPKVAGQAISIVGALIIGEASVQAGIVSPFMVVVVAITGISSFAIPSFSLSQTVRMLRFPLMLLASILGLPALALAMLCLLTYMSALKSFGIPYLSPFSPIQIGKWKDSIIRFPLPQLVRTKQKSNRSVHHDRNEFNPEDW
ncbi:spore germination protein [Paenibacillus sp. PAMC21692]|uniref:spore germination protein n=1 Tax=Paenibacillus sp. PAMC21692 TaxID=2762320 RepID=UPI00164D67AA|nr:spore germination protein [Paenibacillus sp. PAMC21692]QNK57082.1 spore germination protein [Paenibacillus sp. PAMC21692]